jgi:hypothetical protein
VSRELVSDEEPISDRATFPALEKGLTGMARMHGVTPAEVKLGLRLVYLYARRRVARIAGRAALPEPLQVTAHHSRLLRATAHMEMGQEAARSVPARLKLLASIHVARLIGCPF